MINRSKKGSRMEGKCLDELTEYLKNNGNTIIEVWKVFKSRAGGNDYLNSWDIAILYENKYKDKKEIRVQVKSDCRRKVIMALSLKFGSSPIEGYYAMYNPTRRKGYIELPSFKLFLIRPEKDMIISMGW